MVSNYTGYNFGECMELDFYTFAVLLKDAFIYQKRQTEEGQEYLEDCYLFNQTEPDVKKLREAFNND